MTRTQRDTRFLEGDLVLIKPDLKGGEHYGGLYFAGAMEKYIKEGPFQVIYDDGRYYGLMCPAFTPQQNLALMEWSFNSAMLMPVGKAGTNHDFVMLLIQESDWEE